MEVILTKQNFEKEVLQSEIPVIVDFWATWCGPCRMRAPILSEIASEFDGKVKVAKVNVGEEMALAMEYKIEVIPTLIYFEKGEVKKRTMGVLEKKEILANVFSQN